MFSSAMEMLRLDSQLMDLEEDEVACAGYRKVLVGITLNSYANDDECEDKTRFTKGGIRTLLAQLPTDEYVYCYYHQDKYYKFLTEELLIYTLRRMSTTRTHKDLADSEFGGCAKRWGTGYNMFIKLLDSHFAP